MRFSRLFLFFFLAWSALFSVGCGGSDETFVATGTSNPSPASLRIRSVLARAVPANVTDLRITGFDSEQRVLYGPVTRAKAAEILLENVPVAVRRVQIEYLDDGTLVGIGSSLVTLQPGQVTDLVDPDFADVIAGLSLLSVTPETVTLANGTSRQLTATGILRDGTEVDLSSLVQWTSSAPDRVSVSSTGLLLAEQAGSATVTASFQGSSDTSQITVTTATLQSLAVSPSTVALPAGFSQRFEALGFFSDGSVQVLAADWSSSNPQAATIDPVSGLAETLTVGQTTITAEVGQVSANAQLSVTSATLDSLAIEPVDPVVALGLDQAFTVTAYFSDGTFSPLNSGVAWSSSAQGVATVDPLTGFASTVAVGQTTITAAVDDVSTSSTLTVSNAALQELSVLPANALSAPGTKRRYRAVGLYSDGTQRDLTSQVEWSTDNAAVATVSNSNAGQMIVGQASVTGVSGQQVDIQATLGAQQAETTLNVGLYVYVANRDDDTLDAFSVNPSTGALTPTTQGGHGTGDDPYDAKVHPSGRFLYVSNSGDNNVSLFSIDPDTGELDTVGPSIDTGTEPGSLVISPDGRFLYVVNVISENVSSYSIDQNTGELTPLAGTPPAAGSTPFPAVLDPTGRFLYVANFDFPATFTSFTVDQESGLLSPTVPASFQMPFTFAPFPIDPSGRFLYVADGDQVLGYAIDQLTGALAEMVDPFPLTGNFGVTAAVSPNGRFLYAPNSPTLTTFQISGFLIDSLTGALTPTSQSQLAVSDFANGIFLEPGGRFLYTSTAVDADLDEVAGYSINQATGALATAGSVTVGEGAQAMAFTP